MPNPPTQARAARRLRVAALIGDRSPFGQAVLRGLLASPDAETVLLVYPAEGRWKTFARTLAGPEFDTPAPPALARAAAVVRLADARGIVRGVGGRTLRALASVRNGVRARASTPALPTGVPEPARVDDANDPALLERARALGVDVVLVGAFPQKLSGEWAALPSVCGLNVHPSALPRGRGANPIWWTIAAREAEAGLTVHRLAGDFDVGEVLLQRRRPLGPEVGYDALYTWSLEVTPDAVGEALGSLARGEAHWSPQDDARASVYREPRAIHRKVHWEADGADDVVGKVTAGGAFVVLRGIPLGVKRARVLPPGRFLTNALRCAPGSVLSFSSAAVAVRARDGVVELSDLTVFGWRVDVRRALLTVGDRFD